MVWKEKLEDGSMKWVEGWTKRSKGVGENGTTEGSGESKVRK